MSKFLQHLAPHLSSMPPSLYPYCIPPDYAPAPLPTHDRLGHNAVAEQGAQSQVQSGAASPDRARKDPGLDLGRAAPVARRGAPLQPKPKGRSWAHTIRRTGALKSSPRGSSWRPWVPFSPPNAKLNAFSGRFQPRRREKMKTNVSLALWRALFYKRQQESGKQRH